MRNSDAQAAPALPEGSAPATRKGEWHVQRGLWGVIRRSLALYCPNCGEGKLFASYLKQVEQCARCGEHYGHIRSDDAAPWLTILVVGHIVIPIIIVTEKHVSWPDWVAMTVWPGFALALTLFVLPRAKAVFLGVIWATRAPGSERN